MSADRLAQELGDGLRAARDAAGRSLRDLAAEAGTSNVSLTHYENGRNNPTLAKVEDLADIYGVDIHITVTPREG